MKNSGFKTTIGGQALIEGVMMKGPSKTACAVRKPDGNIIVQIKENPIYDRKYPILKLPIIRGAFKLLEAMIVGVKALTFSASFWEEETEKNDKNNTLETIATVGLSSIIAIIVFMVLPSLLASTTEKFVDSSLIFNLVEGIFRLLIFFAYLYLISKSEDIERVFQYHGAEHKSIACYEDGKELTVENVKLYPRTHPRCGTSFLFMVMIISIFILSFFGWPNLFIRTLTRILMFPVIAGISYEINRLIGKYDNNLTYALRVPGLLIQKFATVKEPDGLQIEVGIKSLKAVLPVEGEDDSWT